MRPKDADGIANSVDPGSALFAQTYLSENLGSLQYLQFNLKLGKMLTLLLTITVIFLSFRIDRPGQTVQTQIRLLLEEQSDQDLHCLPFHLHLFDSLLYVQILEWLQQFFGCPKF